MMNQTPQENNCSKQEQSLAEEKLHASEDLAQDISYDTSGIFRRVHPLTPLARVWIISIAILTILIQNGISMLNDLNTDELMHPKTWVLLVVICAILITIILVSGYSFFAWRATGYAITQDSVVFKEGIFFRSERRMRLNRIQAVDVISPLIPRMVGLSKLHVDAAGGADSAIDIYYLQNQQATDLRAEILARAAGLRVQTTQARTVNVDKAGAGDGTEKAMGLVEADPVTAKIDPLGAGILGPLRTQKSALEAPERKIYQVEPSMLILSQLRSVSLWISLGVCLLMLCWPIFIIFMKVNYGGVSLWMAISTSFAMTTPLIIGVFSFVVVSWNNFNTQYNFTASISPDGVRLYHGLTEHSSQTIVPSRVHAVVLKQPLLWRKPDWWRVELTMAAYQNKGDQKNAFGKKLLLPVGTREQALLALWMMERDLGDALDINGVKLHESTGSSAGQLKLETFNRSLLEEMLTGTGSAEGIYAVPRSVRLLDWFTWKRKAMVITTTMTWIRDGWITRKLSFIPHARLQSVSLEQGPVQRKLKVASVHMHLVEGSVPTCVKHQPEELAMNFWQAQVDRARISRSQEGPEEWMLRVYKNAQMQEESSDSGV